MKRELSSFAGMLALKAGRFVALASGIFQVAKHISLGSQEPKGKKIKEVPSEAEKNLQEGASETGYDTVF